MSVMWTTSRGNAIKVIFVRFSIFFFLLVSDAYSASGQKCSAQSILFVHENWTKSNVDLLGKIKVKVGLAGDITCS